VLHSWHFNINNTHTIKSLITYKRHVLWDLLPCMALYDSIIYRQRYATDFVNVGIKLLKK